jgi:hypothetical protein
MKPIYFLVPLVLLLGFGAFYARYTRIKNKPVGDAVIRTKEDYFNGKQFVGRDGVKEAASDFSRGVPKLLGYGLRMEIPEQAEILKQRFGISEESLAGCIVSEPLVSFANAYNAEILRRVAKAFGPTAFNDAVRDALAAREAKRATSKKQ